MLHERECVPGELEKIGGVLRFVILSVFSMSTVDCLYSYLVLSIQYYTVIILHDTMRTVKLIRKGYGEDSVECQFNGLNMGDILGKYGVMRPDMRYYVVTMSQLNAW